MLGQEECQTKRCTERRSHCADWQRGSRSGEPFGTLTSLKGMHNGMATRFKITLRSLTYAEDIGYKNFDYTICTCLGERKAIVMATRVHMTKSPQDHVYQVLGVEKLEGGEAHPADIVDRWEY